ncbi:IS1096 element passenger TnpR family protein [Myroides sp. LJL115]
MVYKFRVILDTEEDIFRDIAILEEDTLEDFHNAIVNAFGFDGMEAASFYLCDDQWEQADQEISLFDMGDDDASLSMASTKINQVLDKEQTKIIYVYDFMNMWTFFVELGAIEQEEPSGVYPDLLFSHGELPDSMPAKNFTTDPMSSDDIYGDYEDDLDSDDYDIFDGDDSFENFDYPEDNWN